MLKKFTIRNKKNQLLEIMADDGSETVSMVQL